MAYDAAGASTGEPVCGMNSHADEEIFEGHEDEPIGRKSSDGPAV
jgi:hypothetical protein